MHLGEIIKNYREKHSLSMDDFSKLSGISKAYISLLEKKVNPRNNKTIAPSIQCIKQAADGMSMDFDVLFNMLEGNVSIVDNANLSKKRTYSIEQKYSLIGKEQEIIEKYRALDDRGKEMVDSVLDQAYKSVPTNDIWKLPNAAHEIAGAYIDDIAHDDDIMERDDF